MKNIMKVMVAAIGVVSLITPKVLQAQEIEYSTNFGVQGNGIVLTQEEAKTLTDEEILLKANLKAYNGDTGEEVDAKFSIELIRVFKSWPVDNMVASGWQDYSEIFNREKVDNDGMFACLTVKVQAPGETARYLPAGVKMVVLGDLVSKHESLSVAGGTDYVKKLDSVLELSYHQYTQLKEHVSKSEVLDKSGELSYLLKRVGYFEVVEDIDDMYIPHVGELSFNIKRASEANFNQFMVLREHGGIVKLEFEATNGYVIVTPSVTIIVNAADTTKVIKKIETKEVEKIKAPNTGDSTNLLFIGLVGLLSGYIVLVRVIKKD